MDETLRPEGPPGPDVQSLTRELGLLREEKRRRQLLDCAREGLRSRGLDGGFAPFLVGEDERQTGQNIGDFEKHFTAALAGEMAKRLPQEAPADLGQATRAPAPRRGIRRL